MKKLLPFPLDDHALLDNLASLVGTSTYPYLDSNLLRLSYHFMQYETYQGDPWTITPLSIPDDLAKTFRARYKSETIHLEYINEIRFYYSSDICPMCGSQGIGTVDHYLPQSQYPDLAIFSKNLIPCCSCNSTRGTTTKGAITGQRVLHPYYDDCLNERLVSCKFSKPYKTPNIQIIALDSGHIEQLAINFHIENVVKNEKFTAWLRIQWSKLERRNSDLLVDLTKKYWFTYEEAKAIINDKIDTYDRSFGTKNNWQSIFLHGIVSDRRVLEWVVQYYLPKISY